MLSKGDYSNVIAAIEVGNIAYLKKLPGIGPKAAQQIVLDLKGHLRIEKQEVKNDNPLLKDVRDALKTFGFKVGEIDDALAKINADNLEVNDIIFKALQFLNKK